MNEQKNEPSVRNKMEEILELLRSQGFKITKQRRIVIDSILKNNCTCCKEIYYQANKVDGNIGIATVYRVIKILEDIGAINKKNQYKVTIDKCTKCETECECDDRCVVKLKNNRTIKLNSEEFNRVLEVGLGITGFARAEEIDSIVLS